MKSIILLIILLMLTGCAGNSVALLDRIEQLQYQRDEALAGIEYCAEEYKAMYDQCYQIAQVADECIQQLTEYKNREL